MKSFVEPSRELPVVEETDVLIAGGGPAGCMAAISAARQGARVRLIEAHGALGGIWTTGCLPHIIENDKSGLLAELNDRLVSAGAARRSGAVPNGYRFNDYDVETFKVVLERMVADAGVDVRLYTRISAAYRNADAIDTVVTDSKNGREAWRSSVYIDATGDGDLGAYAGCSFDIGHPETGQCQPMSVMAVLSGAGEPDAPPFTIRDWKENKDWILAEIRRGGHDPSYGRPTMFLVRPGYIVMMANHEYGYRYPDAQHITDATIRGRAENLSIADALRSQGGRWKNLEVTAQSAQIGIRESRRIAGIYRVTRDDVATGARFPDAVCRVSFSVDIHALDPDRNKGIDDPGITVKPYDIPLRSLISSEVSNLMMAGRCISGDFYAHASYRVTGDAAAIGKAAGIAAAVSAKRNVAPAKLAFEDIAPLLPLID